MPFTLAHPAAVLPLRRTGLVFSALVVGSMAPDFPYFLSVSDAIRWGHSTRGVFLFCLPFGLLVLWLFHAGVKRPLLSLAPEFMRQRISKESLEFRFGPGSRLLLILASLLLGTITHILWDGFTHDHGYFVKHWALLSVPVMTYRVMPLWRALQGACSVLGVALVFGVAAWWWYRKPTVAEPVASEMTPKLRWFIVAVAGGLASLAGVAAGLGYLRLHGWKASLVEGVIVAISAGCVEILLFSLAWHANRSRAEKQKPLDREIQRLNVTAER